MAYKRSIDGNVRPGRYVPRKPVRPPLSPWVGVPALVVLTPVAIPTYGLTMLGGVLGVPDVILTPLAIPTLLCWAIIMGM